MIDDDVLYKHLGQLIRERRTELGLTQGEVAGRIGLTRTSVTNIERGTQAVNVATLFRMAEVLEMEVSELLPRPLDARSAIEDDPHLSETLRREVLSLLDDSR